ncbi:MAG: acyl-CoA/acyl-ACP dehydrogenase [Chloroflexi bacterium]|nr:acyl-CoA/acyl-ACP dehydrogenase [Chloroflexota bacterium]
MCHRQATSSHEFLRVLRELKLQRDGSIIAPCRTGTLGARCALGGNVDFRLTSAQQAIREQVRAICHRYGDEYWRKLDEARAYPEAFVQELTRAGWLAALIPEEYDGAGLGILEGSLILEEINRSGGNSAACHAQMYIMGTLLRHGNAWQKRTYLPKIARGELRLQAFGVTEPNAGSETTRISTFAERRGDRYVVNGQKIFISRVQHSDLMLLLARTTRYDDVADKTQGISVFLVDLRTAGKSIEVRPLETMINHETNQLFISDLEVPADHLIGEEGRGFRYIIDGWNAERILIAAECIGDGRWFVERASRYAGERVVFGRPIGQNQGVQFPIAAAYARVEAADLMRFKAATLFDRGERCGAEANLAKYLASEAAWEAANVAMNVHGGYGLASEYAIERKFRETRLFLVAPINNNLVLAFLGQHVLGMPKSY